MPVASRALRILESIDERLQQRLAVEQARQERATNITFPNLQSTNEDGPNEPLDITLYLDRLTTPWLEHDLGEMDWLNFPQGSE